MGADDGRHRPPGYRNFLGTIGDPNHEDYDAMLERVGYEYFWKAKSGVSQPNQRDGFQGVILSWIGSGAEISTG